MDEVTEADVQRMTNGGTNSTNMIVEIVEDDSIISPPATGVQVSGLNNLGYDFYNFYMMAKPDIKK